MTTTEMFVPHLSMSSDEDVAFKVLNRDELPEPMALVGETIFKPFGNDPRAKPNVIVHPTRRVVTNLEENKNRPFAKSHGNIAHGHGNINGGSNRITSNQKRLSHSHGHLNHHNSTTGVKTDDFNSQVDAKFTKTLDAKLRRLQREEKHQQQVGKKVQNQQQQRKPFVTTVPKGTFLEPPQSVRETRPFQKDKEEPNKWKKDEGKKLFTYASQPRVLNRSPGNWVHVQKCAAALAAARIAGSVAGFNRVNDSSNIESQEINYGNVMYDKRVFRGSNFAQPHLGDGESAAARAAEARRRALARRKAKNQHYKSSQLRLGSPPPVAGRRHENIQTETYLEELFVTPPVADICTQTDLFVERPVSPFYVPAKTGADVETQIYPGDLFDFDMEVQPILEVLVGKTVEQALIEVLEEEELAALREQQRRFLELRATETAEALRLEEREKRLVKEKERRLAEHEEGLKIQKEMEERIAAAVLMQGYMADLLPSVIEGLESEGFLMDNIKEDVDSSFMPWLVKEVTQELQDMVCSRDVLSDIVREILENRAEIYNALHKEPSTDETEEEGPSVEDMILQDHLRLQKEIQSHQPIEENPQ